MQQTVNFCIAHVLDKLVVFTKYQMEQYNIPYLVDVKRNLHLQPLPMAMAVSVRYLNIPKDSHRTYSYCTGGSYSPMDYRFWIISTFCTLSVLCLTPVWMVQKAQATTFGTVPTASRFNFYLVLTEPTALYTLWLYCTYCCAVLEAYPEAKSAHPAEEPSTSWVGPYGFSTLPDSGSARLVGLALWFIGVFTTTAFVVPRDGRPPKHTVQYRYCNAHLSFDREPATCHSIENHSCRPSRALLFSFSQSTSWIM